MNYLKIYLLFWIFSIGGWIMEEIVCSISDKKLVNRGFLIGPYCPIYGFGALIMLLLSPYKDSPVTCFILASFLCSVLEYITSYVMEKMFKIRWWDYSTDSFNINGRVCLRNALAFGALGVLFVRYLNPFFSNIVNNMSEHIIIIVSIIMILITLTDIIVSFITMNSIKNIINANVNKFIHKDATQEVKNIIHQKLKNINFFERRLINTYKLDDIKNKISKLNNNGYNIILIFSVLGTILGVILGLLFKVDDLIIIISFTISIFILIAIVILKAREK